jgi:hypothetical protein
MKSPHVSVLIGLLTLTASAAEPYKTTLPFGDFPHDYWERQPTDAVTQLVERLRTGEAKLIGSGEKEVLLGLLKHLDVPVNSQLLVYSGTSLQSGLIRPENPRALYFNEETYVGFVPGGKLELASIDPAIGPIFYIVSPNPDGASYRAERTTRCMNCHAGNAMYRLPGFFTESVIPSSSGGSLDGFRRDLVGHTVKLEDRFGGWHVTGPHAKQFPLANLMGRSIQAKVERLANPPGKQFDLGRYPVPTSDLFTHLVHEHQLEFHNLVTLAAYTAREVDKGRELSAEEIQRVNAVARDMVRYLLFAGEAKLPSGGVKPEPEFHRSFLARKKASNNGQSLRDLDLRSRLFKNRCSYMIYTRSFQEMPKLIKDRVMTGLQSALSDAGLPEFNYLPQEERRAIRTILAETLPTS